ncbi:hypothetical protein Dimus_038108 [Dionaea muscipula]
MVRTRSGKHTHESDLIPATMEITMDALKTMFQDLLAQTEEKMMGKISELKEEMRVEWRDDMDHYLEKGKSSKPGNTSSIANPPLRPNPSPSSNVNPISLSPNSTHPYL